MSIENNEQPDEAITAPNTASDSPDLATSDKPSPSVRSEATGVATSNTTPITGVVDSTNEAVDSKEPDAAQFQKTTFSSGLGKNEVSNTGRVTNSTVNISIGNEGNSNDRVSPAPPITPQASALTLTPVKCGDPHLDRLPHASSFMQKLESTFLILDTRHSGMANLASLALCRSFERRSLENEKRVIQCKTTTVNDAALPQLQAAVDREKPDVLVLYLTHGRLLEETLRYGFSIQTGGVKVIISAPEDSLERSRHPKVNLWSLNTAAELLNAIEADEETRTRLADSQRSHLWPTDEHWLADLLAVYIMEDGGHAVRRNLPYSQEQTSDGALAIAEAAAKRPEDGVIDRALLFLVSHFPEIPIAEIDRLMESLLAGEEFQVSNNSFAQASPKSGESAEQEKPAFIPVAAIDHWRRHRREILARNSLSSKPGTGGSTTLVFKHSLWNERIKKMLDPWDVEDHVRRLHDSRLLLDPEISPPVVDGLIKATGALFASAPRSYDANWLVRQVTDVNLLKDIYVKYGSKGAIRDENDFFGLWLALNQIRIGGQQLSKLLYERIANLCWSIMGFRPEVIRQFIEKLSSDARFGARGGLALEIVLRLRSQQQDDLTAFDAWGWLRHLLATGSPETCSNVIKQLVHDSKVSAIATWQTLIRVMEWLRPAQEWTGNDSIQSWAFAFLYEGFRQDIDRYFFVDDEESVTPWSERRFYLLRWLIHPGFASAMDWHFGRGHNIPGWVQHAPEENIPLNGEICIAELMDYWYHDWPGREEAAGGRARELIRMVNEHMADLPRSSEPTSRPNRREVWLGVRTLSAAWSHHAMFLSKKSLRADFRRRRDSAYDLAEIFR